MGHEPNTFSNDQLSVAALTCMLCIVCFCFSNYVNALEGLLIPSPFYGSFTLDFQTRSRVIPFPVPLSSEVSLLLYTETGIPTSYLYLVFYISFVGNSNCMALISILFGIISV